MKTLQWWKSCGFAAWMLVLPAWATAQPVGKASPAGECTAANRLRVAELVQTVDAARAKHLLEPVRVARLQAAAVQVSKLREATQRTARTVADCDALAAQIDAESQRLARITGSEDAPASPAAPEPAVPSPRAAVAAPPPPDPACITSVGQDFNEVAQLLTQLQRARGEGAEPDAELAGAAARLNTLRQGLLAALKTPPDDAGCARLSLRVTEEAAALQLLQRTRAAAAAPAPAVAPVVAAAAAPAPCIAANSQAYDDLVQRFGALLQRGALPGHVMPPAQALGRQLAALSPQVMPARTSAAECTGNARALAHAEGEMQRVTALLAGPPPVRVAAMPRQAAEEEANAAGVTTVVDRRARACVTELRLNFDQVLQLAGNLNSRAKLNAEGRAQLKRLLQDLLLQQVLLFSRDLISLDECQQIARTFSNLRAQVHQVGAVIGAFR